MDTFIHDSSLMLSNNTDSSGLGQTGPPAHPTLPQPALETTEEPANETALSNRRRPVSGGVSSLNYPRPRSMLMCLQPSTMELLPTEVLQHIAFYIYRKDIREMCNMSRYFREKLAELYYHTLTVKATGEYTFDRFPAAFYTDFSPRSAGLYFCRYIKHLHFMSLFQNIPSRCAHNYGRGSFGEGLEEPFHAAGLGLDFSRLLEQIPNGNLLNFRYLCLQVPNIKFVGLTTLSFNLGVCLPRGLLESTGLLAQQQQNINNISLITDPYCDYDEMSQLYEAPNVDLYVFKQLTQLTWIGICTESEASQITRLAEDEIKLEALHLEAADLISYFEPLPRGCVSPTVHRRKSFFRSMLTFIHWGLTQDDEEGTIKAFTHLKQLGLSKFDFDGVNIPLLVQVFNMEKLESLVLRCNDEMGSLLVHLGHIEPSLKLKKLELIFEEDDDTVNLLLSFQGLRALYIMHGRDDLPPLFWEAIDHHVDTLERLVVHNRLQQARMPSCEPPETLDCEKMTLHDHRSQHGLSTMVQCVGLAIYPFSDLVSIPESGILSMS